MRTPAPALEEGHLGETERIALEIDELHLILDAGLAAHHHVAGMDPAVVHVVPVGMPERHQELHCDLQSPCRRKGGRLEQLLERVPIDPFSDDQARGFWLRDLLQIEELGDIGVGEAGQAGEVPLQALTIPIALEPSYRNRPIQAELLRFKDLGRSVVDTTLDGIARAALFARRRRCPLGQGLLDPCVERLAVFGEGRRNAGPEGPCVRGAKLVDARVESATSEGPSVFGTVPRARPKSRTFTCLW